VIYFVRSPKSLIKIGTTTRLSKRLKQLAAKHGEGLELLAVTKGSFRVERRLHRKFSHLHRGGEWFEPGNDLVDFIISKGKPWDGLDETPRSGAMATKTLARHSLSYQMKEIIDSRGLTPHAVATLAEVDPGIVSRWMAGRRDIRLETADKLARALGLRLAETARWTGKGKKPRRPGSLTVPTVVVDLEPAPASIKGGVEGGPP
jgi:Helix-turn-helix/T5orf172 domain